MTQQPFLLRFCLIIVLLLLCDTMTVLAQRDDFRAPSLYSSSASAKKTTAAKVQRTESARQETVQPAASSVTKPLAKPADAPASEQRSYISMSNYELEVAASRGDIEAKTALGARWVRSSDSIRHENGVKYLRDARNHGSQEARKILETLNIN